MKRINLTCVLLLVTLACGIVTPEDTFGTQDIITATAESVNTAIHIHTLTPTASPVYVVAGDWNLRDGATEDSTKRGELRDGQTVMIRFCRPDGWCRLDNDYYLCGRAIGLTEVCE